MRQGSPITYCVMDANSPRPSLVSPLFPHVQRKITKRWKWWEPLVLLEFLSNPDYNPTLASVGMSRMRQRHTQQILAFTTAGFSMKLIRRHRLDDPRITDELRATLVRAMVKRRSYARLGEQATSGHANIESWLTSYPTDAAIAGFQSGHNSSNDAAPSPQYAATPEELRQTINAIQKRVSNYFYLRELRDPELKVRSRKQVFAFPRQVAMYIARRLTRASLQELGAQFGGTHHATVLHAVNKIEQMRRLDKNLDRTIERLCCALADSRDICGFISQTATLSRAHPTPTRLSSH
jgi:Bacterial dnaA protein helix-turn-helix